MTWDDSGPRAISALDIVWLSLDRNFSRNILARAPTRRDLSSPGRTESPAIGPGRGIRPSACWTLPARNPTKSFLVSAALHLHFDAGNQPKLAVRDDSLTRLNSLRNHGLPANRSRDFDLPLFRRHVLSDDVHEIPGLPRLHRLRRHYRGVFLLRQPQRNSGKLPGPEPVIGIRERALQLDGPGRVIHRVIHERQIAGLGFRIAVWRCARLQASLRHIPLDHAQILLRNRKVDVKRRNLVDHDEDRNVILLDDIPRIHLQSARASIYRRINLAILQLELRGLYSCFVRLYGRFLRHRRGFHRIELFFRGDARSVQFLVALRLNVIQLSLSLVARKSRLSLCQRRLKRPPVQSEQKIALLDEVPLLEVNLLQNRVHLRLDRNCAVRLPRTNQI